MIRKPSLTSLGAPMLTAVLCVVAASHALAGAAPASQFDDGEFFGRLSISDTMKPAFVHGKAVQARGTVDPAVAPLVLHVREGEEERWGARCQAYDACTVPVRFVTEGWFREVYLPEVSAQDGREQRYRDLVRPQREAHTHRCGVDDESTHPEAKLTR